MPYTSEILTDRYQLAGRIAVGGMGEVWRAVDTVLDRPVAVKLLRPEYASHAETLARFRAEARHAGALSHPGIARVYDFGEAGPEHVPYLVLELVDGPALTAMLAAGPLGPAATMDIVAQSAAGLDAAHAAGLVHRDIKPGNLLIAADGQVKITDFGIAHAAGSAPVTRTGTLIGTPGYLAPERVSGASATPASDIYSLGIVAFECLSGRPPFAGTGIEVALAHRDQPLPPLPPELSGEVTALVEAMTAKDPADRPASAGATAQRAGQLRDALASGALAAGGPDYGGPGHAEAGYGEAGYGGPDGAAGRQTLTLAGVPAGAAAFAGGPGGREWPGEDPAGPRGRAWTTPTVLAGVAAVAVAAGLIGWLLASALGGSSAPSQAAAQQPPRTAAAEHVTVSKGALVGLPLENVRQQLRKDGLRVRAVGVPFGDQPPGTVISVDPHGRLRAGTIVTVRFAAPPRHHGDHGQGNGDGQGHGGSGDGGGNGDGGGG
jgi:hypothetical protein